MAFLAGDFQAAREAVIATDPGSQPGCPAEKWPPLYMTMP